MQCPTCSVDLVMSERQGVEIDYCPKCRGIWLDRGELDKIIEREASVSAVDARRQPGPISPDESMRRRDHDDDDDYGMRQGRRRRGGFLSELFGGGDD